MNDINALVDRYIAAWNESDRARRRELVAQTWTGDGIYVDPLMSGEGPDEIAELIGAAQSQYPGHRFELAAGPDAHNDRVRFSWHLIPDGGEPVALGIDFGIVDEDGRFSSVTGFLEQVG